MELVHILEIALEYLVQFAIIVFEFIGVGVIIFAGMKGFLNYLRRAPEMKINLAQGLAIGLEFKLGSEILKTVIVRDWTEIVTVAGIIALRAALTFLIHWEIKEENKDKLEQEERAREQELQMAERGKTE
ncbi:MAG: DUF1622 domain-containing protein [Lachnospiraceae bacterium]|nr:DUF1622 domain-containing protein [Lachnospiraceae bacterium]MBP3609082.1 DUF1622 domain-containing protein [Lachnospiraceae bacterium]